MGVPVVISVLGSGLSSPSPASNRPARASRPKLVFAVVAMGLFMASIDQTIVATALASVERELHARIQWGGWTVTAYALGQMLVMPIAGKASDLYGRKRILLTAVSIFTASSLLCGLADNIYLLIMLRALQALGGGSIMPSASGIVADQFGGNRDRALGLFSSIFPLGGVVGPLLGGIFVTYWSWRGIFLVNVPVGILLLVLGTLFIPSSAAHKRGRFDAAGVLWLGVLILGTMLGITQIGDGEPLVSPRPLVCFALALAALALFLRHSRGASEPFLPTNFLVGRGFGVMNILNFLYGSAAIGFAALVPLYAQYRFALPPLQAGTLLTARAVGMIGVAALATFALRRTGYRMPMIVGFLLVSLGLVLMFLPPPGVSTYAWLAMSAAVTGLGMGLSVPAANNATLQLATSDVAAISGLRGMFRQAGSIMSVSVVTAVIARSADPGMALGGSFLLLAAVLAAFVPFVFLVPNYRGAW